jgi:hypothetical protein
MLIQGFGARAQECIALAERARSEHDRHLFIAMAPALCGVSADEIDEAGARGRWDRRMTMARRRQH